jgi:fimbrial chaperone protein
MMQHASAACLLRRAGALAAWILACAAPVQAAGVNISPVVIEIDSPRKAVAITVTNNGDRPINLQTDAMVWRQVNGIDQYEPTDEMLVVPPIAQVQPNASQIFRVVLRAPTRAPEERTYRLILEDTSDDLNPSGQTSVAFKFTHNLPVMVAPSAKAFSAVRWKPCTPTPSLLAEKPLQIRSTEACVRLLNAGNRRVKIQTLTLTGDGWQQALPLKEGVNVLAGAEREWRVPLPAGAGTLRTVQVQTARGEALAAEPGGF